MRVITVLASLLFFSSVLCGQSDSDCSNLPESINPGKHYMEHISEEYFLSASSIPHISIEELNKLLNSYRQFYLSEAGEGIIIDCCFANPLFHRDLNTDKKLWKEFDDKELARALSSGEKRSLGKVYFKKSLNSATSLAYTYSNYAAGAFVIQRTVRQENDSIFISSTIRGNASGSRWKKLMKSAGEFLWKDANQLFRDSVKAWNALASKIKTGFTEFPGQPNFPIDCYIKTIKINAEQAHRILSYQRKNGLLERIEEHIDDKLRRTWLFYYDSLQNLSRLISSSAGDTLYSLRIEYLSDQVGSLLYQLWPGQTQLSLPYESGQILFKYPVAGNLMMHVPGMDATGMKIETGLAEGKFVQRVYSHGQYETQLTEIIKREFLFQDLCIAVRSPFSNFWEALALDQFNLFVSPFLPASISVTGLSSLPVTKQPVLFTVLEKNRYGYPLRLNTNLETEKQEEWEIIYDCP